MSIRPVDFVGHPPRKSGLAGLCLVALGVVFGDIGTSPLYAMKTVFSIEHNEVKATATHVFGIISMVFWSVMIVVGIKYVLILMRAGNEGEGGLLALVALLRRRLRKWRGLPMVMTFGMVGAALFLGDSVITPAISVLSAVEGLAVVSPGHESWVLPIAIAILTLLFAVQRHGTSTIGKAFGPIMLCWFAVLMVIAVPHILSRPDVLGALSPHHAARFALAEPVIAFVALGAVVLTITGAEALYADMGHFGARPIQLACLGVVFPALIINYLGQGAMILADPTTSAAPFFSLAPQWARLPLVILATVATVIASQAVIAGGFSVARQAYRLGLLPRMTVRHTSAKETGQIYLPAVNWLLYGGVLVLIVLFQSSERLASAYGLAVTGTLLATSALFALLAREVWLWSWVKLTSVLAPIVALELCYFAANVVKLLTGGWLPVLIATLLVLVMSTWRRGATLTRARRIAVEGPWQRFVTHLRDSSIQRVPGTAIYPHGDLTSTPFALKSNAEFNGVLHERIVIVQLITVDLPHVRHVDRVKVLDCGGRDLGIVHVTVTVGYTDTQDLPIGLRRGAEQFPELYDPTDGRYFISVMRLADDRRGGMSRWRTKLFIWMARNAASRAVELRLPIERTAIVGGNLAI